MDYETRRTIESLRLRVRRIRYARKKRHRGLLDVGVIYTLVCPVWLRKAFENSLQALDKEESGILKEIKRLRTAKKE